MKTPATILLCLLATAFCRAQNLVPNPSFEVYDTCPNTWSRVPYALGWDIAISSPDYYNTCSLNDAISPPNTGFGYQFAHTGNAYVGLSIFDRDVPNYREAITCKLNSPLIEGTTYYFAFYVNLGGAYSLAANKLGLLCTNSKFSTSSPVSITNSAHYFIPNSVTDTADWIHFTGSFVADSNYDYIVIGNFFDDQHTDTIGIGSVMDINAYYFIDDLYLSYNPQVDIPSLQQITPIQIFPNPATTKLYCNNRIKATLYTLCGEAVKELDFTQGNEVDVTEISNGVYVVSYEYEGRRYLVKQVMMH